MKVLLIEDDGLKAERIIEFLATFGDPPVVSHEKSYNSGLRAALSTNPDLIILDMTLPTYDVKAKAREGRSRTMGGVDLMRKLELRGSTTPVVIVSQFTSFGEGVDMIGFSELMQQCEAEFADIFVGGVRYRASSNSWMAELRTIMDEVTLKC